MRRSWLFLGAVAACGAGLLCGCSSSHQTAAATCGTASTAAGVPVTIEVSKGTGGGAPVAVSGWTCQGYSTPQILQTGDASQCHTSTAEILAVLPTPTATP